MKQNDRGDYILMAAVRLGSGEVVDAVAKVLKDYLTSEQVSGFRAVGTGKEPVMIIKNY